MLLFGLLADEHRCRLRVESGRRSLTALGQLETFDLARQSARSSRPREYAKLAMAMNPRRRHQRFSCRPISVGLLVRTPRGSVLQSRTAARTAPASAFSTRSVRPWSDRAPTGFVTRATSSRCPPSREDQRPNSGKG